MIVRRVEALGRFLDTDDGGNLLVGYRRAANILRAEEKKEGDGSGLSTLPPRSSCLAEERTLAGALLAARPRRSSRAEEISRPPCRRSRIAGAGRCLLRQGDGQRDDTALRLNRLRLLNELRAPCTRWRISPRSPGEGATNGSVWRL